MKIRKPVCPKCQKQMRLKSTGIAVQTFYCSTCKETETVKREVKNDAE